MFHPRHFNALRRRTLSAVPALLLLFTTFAVARPARAVETAAQVPPIPPGGAYRQTNLYSSIPGYATSLDLRLVRPWGIAETPRQPFTVADTALGTLNFYPLGDGIDRIPLPDEPPVALVISNSSDFERVSLMYTSTKGHLVAWNFFSTAPAKVIVSPGGFYTGVTIASILRNNLLVRYLYAADFTLGTIDVFDTTFQKQTSGFAFSDPTVPPDFHPYNVKFMNGMLFVTYAKVGPDGHPQKGPGLGYVRTFTPEGVALPYGLSGGTLNAPWGMEFAFRDFFGMASDSALVANTGDGTILAFNLERGDLGQLKDEGGQPLSIDGLRGLLFRPSLIGPSPSSPFPLYFTSERGLLGTLRPTTSTATSLVQFATDNFRVDEAGKFVDFTVVRTGDTTGAATVNYNTFEEQGTGHASQKSDYEIALGTLTFAPGETSKTFRILIADDRLDEPDETIGLALSNPTGVSVGLGSLTEAAVTILDNDAGDSPSNVIDDTTFFVRQHYLDFLNREPDPSGLQFWIGEIEQCGADLQCREVKRINVSAAFFLSIEFQRTGVLAYRANKAAFGQNGLGGRAPVPVLYGQFMRDVQQLRQNLTFGQPGFDAQLEANEQAYFAYLVARPEFISIHQLVRPPAEFVDELYANAGMVPTSQERAAAIDEFGGATNSSDQDARARVLRRVAENPTFARNEFNRAFVLMEYFGYLRRDPDAAGYQFWLDKMNAFNGDFIRAEMVKAFLSSDEYRQRFGP